MKRLVRWSDHLPGATLSIAINRALLSIQRREDEQAAIAEKVEAKLSQLEAEQAERDRAAREARLRR